MSEATLIRQSTVTTRKARRCDYCNKEIPAKTSGIGVTVLSYDGLAYSLYGCPECQAFIDSDCSDCRDKHLCERVDEVGQCRNIREPINREEHERLLDVQS